MSEYMILEHGAPTLAGMKTGNLISCPFSSRTEVRSDLRRLNRMLRGKGLRMIPLKYLTRRVLIYIYRPDMLARDLADPGHRSILSECGYRCGSESECICTLIRRMASEQDFPHEIGLFLGYPVEDVRGFMEHHGADSKLTGVWKVYGDPESCRKTFEAYRRCTEEYCRAGRKGKSIGELAVAAV